ncbi:MAG: hypothetical protein NVSMB2_26070 [Chloroflexota bacterium]
MKVSLDRIAALIREAEMVATVMDSGGSCATLYASRRADAYGTPFSAGAGADDLRAEILLGPGWFAEDGSAWGSLGDHCLSICADDQGLTPSVYATERDTEETLARVLVERLHALTVAEHDRDAPEQLIRERLPNGEFGWLRPV